MFPARRLRRTWYAVLMMTIHHLTALLLASPEFMTLLAHGASEPVLLRTARALPPIAAAPTVTDADLLTAISRIDEEHE